MSPRHILLAVACGFTLVACAFAAIPTSHPAGPANVIRPGELWPDDQGNHVQAHGGDVVKVGNAFYWFGEDRTRGLDRAQRYVGCYSSTDLIRWTFRRRITFDDPENLGRGWVLERPKVYANARTGKFVMYMHLDNRQYAAARVAVAVSDAIDGEYKFLKSFRPLDHDSRDIGQFIDDDGTGYLIFESRPNGFFIAKLSDDYLSVEKQTAQIRQPMEGGAIVKYDGLYYVLGSWMTGWDPNSNRYATSKSLEGPWSEFHDIAPREKKTYGSQSTFLLKVVGTRTTSVIFMGDIWRPRTQWDSRYLWMPLEIGNGQMHLPEPADWTIDVKTGETKILRKPATQPHPDNS